MAMLRQRCLGDASVDPTMLRGSQEDLPSKLGCGFEGGCTAVVLDGQWAQLSASRGEMLHILVELHPLTSTQNLALVPFRRRSAQRGKKQCSMWKEFHTHQLSPRCRFQCRLIWAVQEESLPQATCLHCCAQHLPCCLQCLRLITEVQTIEAVPDFLAAASGSDEHCWSILCGVLRRVLAVKHGCEGTSQSLQPTWHAETERLERPLWGRQESAVLCPENGL